MKSINKQLLLFLLFSLIVLLNISFIKVSYSSEPIVVLNYSSAREDISGLNKNNKFISNPSYSVNHKVKINETLGHILYAYYGKSGLNLRIVEMAIVEYNPRAFRNRNPNYLFAEKTIYLPSLTEIKDLVLGKNKSPKTNTTNNSSHIYFFGG